MTASVAGAPLIKSTIRMPAVGAWHADIDATRESALSGTVTMSIEGVDFVGAVIRSGLSGSRSKARLVGGKGGLSKELDAKPYDGPTVGQVVADILREAGETLSSAADASTRTFRLQKWERLQGSAGHALTAVLAAAGAIWRTERGGAVWYGPQSWATQTVTHRLIDEDWTSGMLEIAPDAPDLLPGVTFRSQRVEQVIHRLGSGSLRTEAYMVRPGSSLERILGGILRKVDYSRLWPCTVVSQHADKRLELNPDDEVIRGTGLDNVPIRHGLPGVEVTVQPGARVHVGFDGGDPSRPFAALWDPGTFALTDLLSEIKIGKGLSSVIRVGDTVSIVPGTGGAGPVAGVITVTLGLGVPPEPSRLKA